MSPKNSSIRGLTTLAIGAAAAILGTLPVAAPAQTVTLTAPLELSETAPDKHVVVKGDTLWDISATFLKAPWRWPEVWQLNREQIANPHLIYPGEIVYLDRSGAVPRLRLGRPLDGSSSRSAQSGGGGQGNRGGDGSSRLEPVVRAEQLDRSAISTVSLAAIEPFLNRPLVVDEKGLTESPRIIATQEGRVYLGRGDRAYVRGLNQREGPATWHIYRPARPLIDPETRKPIAYEALFLGSAKVVRKGDPATIEIIGNAEEIGEGDRLVPAESDQTVNFAPSPPSRDVRGRIVSVYRGITQVGRNSVVALNVGKNNGLEVGNVLAVELTGRLAKDRQANELVKLPNEPIGQLLVFRTFDNIAYGLIVDASQSISVGDSVINP